MWFWENQEERIESPDFAEQNTTGAALVTFFSRLKTTKAA